jgi:hypothetical protein
VLLYRQDKRPEKIKDQQTELVSRQDDGQRYFIASKGGVSNEE